MNDHVVFHYLVEYFVWSLLLLKLSFSLSISPSSSLTTNVISIVVFSGGDLIERDGKKYKIFYGMSSSTAMKKHAGGIAEYRCCILLI